MDNSTPFNFARDCRVTTGHKDTYINFTINRESISENELKEQGYNVSNGKASDTVSCDTATYTFTNLPSTLEDIKSIPLDTKFAPMAACICAIAAYEEKPGPNSMYDHPIYEMFDYINGPILSINNVQRSGIYYSMKQTLSYGKYAYFDGAGPKNNYTPNTPYTFTMVESPYYIPAKASTIAFPNGTPERRMILIAFEGDDSQRYIDVYHSSDGNWYCWDSSWKHLVAGMKDPTAPTVW
jgi:hypothetical protein